MKSETWLSWQDVALSEGEKEILTPNTFLWKTFSKWLKLQMLVLRYLNLNDTFGLQALAADFLLLIQEKEAQ